jgi:hypothetical protein
LQRLTGCRVFDLRLATSVIAPSFADPFKALFIDALSLGFLRAACKGGCRARISPRRLGRVSPAHLLARGRYHLIYQKLAMPAVAANTIIGADLRQAGSGR